MRLSDALRPTIHPHYLPEDPLLLATGVADPQRMKQIRPNFSVEARYSGLVTGTEVGAMHGAIEPVLE